jgi:hypothetical protein
MHFEGRGVGQPLDVADVQRRQQQPESRDGDGKRIEVHTKHLVKCPLGQRTHFYAWVISLMECEETMESTQA